MIPVTVTTVPAPLDGRRFLAPLSIATLKIRNAVVQAAITAEGHLWCRSSNRVVVLAMNTEHLPYGDAAAVAAYELLAETINAAESAGIIDPITATALHDFASEGGDYDLAWAMGRALPDDHAARHAREIAEMLKAEGRLLPVPLDPPTPPVVPDPTWPTLPCTKDTLLPRVRWSDRQSWNGSHDDDEAYAMLLEDMDAIVVDTDVRDDGDGEENLHCLAEKMGGNLPRTFTTRTPSGGFHRFYRMPEGATRPKQSIGKIAPHVDVVTGIARGPGSVRHDGRYEVVDYSEMAEVPGWILLAVENAQRPPEEAIRVLRAAARSIHNLSSGQRRRLEHRVLRKCVENVLRAEVGTRNTTLNTAVYTAARAGADPEDITKSMAAAAEEIGMPEAEARSVIERAIADGRRDREEDQ